MGNFGKRQLFGLAEKLYKRHPLSTHRRGGGEGRARVRTILDRTTRVVIPPLLVTPVTAVNLCHAPTNLRTSPQIHGGTRVHTMVLWPWEGGIITTYETSIFPRARAPTRATWTRRWEKWRGRLPFLRVWRPGHVGTGLLAPALPKPIRIARQGSIKEDPVLTVDLYVSISTCWD